ncbi:MAG: polyprenyl synthetase family protein [Candidatus Hydrogenedentes bacterium]|nr:polyprenyl synthetase family protein [Candidatus Hydrogenedentota bacterium]
MTVTEFLEQKGERTERALRAYFDTISGGPKTLREAMEYSLFAGGKRLRPALALGAAELICGEDTRAIPAACALEMIHTYSLMHDDLPCMDNDDLRRGKPTAHRAFGEAMAILAGDTLLTLAFDVAAQADDIRIIREIARASGADGMAGGQVIDLESEDKQLTLAELRHLHERKTGALIRASVRCGAMLGGASEAQLRNLTAYGEHIGLAFQIADDILDVVGEQELIGKPVGSDAANNKSTYISVLGLERARELGSDAVNSAVASLETFGPEAEIFRELARFIVERES